MVISGLLFSCVNQKDRSDSAVKPIDWEYYIDKANTDESRVPEYILPDLLIDEADEAITDRLSWMEKRRPEILDLYKNEIYGRVPEWNGRVEFVTTKEIPGAISGKALMKEVTALFINEGDTVRMNILIYLPDNGEENHPLFLGLNFFGNHTVYPDTNIAVADGYVINKSVINVKNHRSTEAGRGVMDQRWQVEKLIDRGYGLATIFYGDIDPDFDDGFQNGIHPLFYKEGQNRPDADQWGSISAWAWGLSRAMDYFETDPQINENQVAVLGHSRLGKTALWAGATDKRFAITISNNSGSGGAALFRRRFGETIEVSVAAAPQWYCGNFRKYSGHEDALPVDQHMLISLMAPRPVYIASAGEDSWADPTGEFLAAKQATPVYALFNKSNSIGYHLREGVHNITAYDWDRYIAFAELHFSDR
ncbi:MAG: acetylxylan esterase [Bacteroidota bacterium]